MRRRNHDLAYIFFEKYKYIHRTCPMAMKLGLSKSGHHFANFFYTLPKSYKDCYTLFIQLLKLKIDSSHCILPYDEVINICL